MKTLCRSLLLFLFLAASLLEPMNAQMGAAISDSEAAQHVGQKATVEGIDGMPRERRNRSQAESMLHFVTPMEAKPMLRLRALFWRADRISGLIKKLKIE
jgi:hypothetical protein